MSQESQESPASQVSSGTDASAAADRLQKALEKLDVTSQVTVADAAAASGLPLRDAERALFELSTRYRGTLSTTEQGELLFRFPHGYSLPLTKRPWFQRAVDRVKNVVTGVARFVVRAWVSIALIGYAAIFVGVAIALMMSGNRDSDRGGGGGFFALHVILRLIAEALFWTFHPFSPMARRNVYDGSLHRTDAYANLGRRTRTRTVRRFGELITIEEPVADDDGEKVPFYEKVNRWAFGPDAEKEAPELMQQRLVAQIRANKGRIGLLDVMRVTGLPRQEADPLMARLMLDYDGDVDVDEDGAITYRFEALRKTAGDVSDRAPPPAWTRKKEARAVTGNTTGSNFLIGAINGFNLIMATVALNMNMTVDRLVHLLSNIKSAIPVEPLPYDGIPIALGVVPLVFSLLLFALPSLRLLWNKREQKNVAEENARAAVLKTVFQSMEKAAVDGAPVNIREDTLKRAWQKETGQVPDDKTLIREVVALGGDVDENAMAEGRGLYRFRDLEAEVKALQRERAAAKESEAEVGEVIFRAE